jgi:hypothetical protein
MSQPVPHDEDVIDGFLFLSFDSYDDLVSMFQTSLSLIIRPK